MRCTGAFTRKAQVVINTNVSSLNIVMLLICNVVAINVLTFLLNLGLSSSGFVSVGWMVLTAALI